MGPEDATWTPVAVSAPGTREPAAAMEEVEEVVECATQHIRGKENGVPYCENHATSMNPAIWSDLPKELLQRVFARLHDPKMFAIVPGTWFYGIFTATLYDLRSNTRHAMEIDIGYQRRYFHTMNASDGGLVCMACMAREEKSFSVLILVCNPLTRAVRTLPLHSHYKRRPKMLQLVMDRVSKCYRVLIVSADQNRGHVAEIFHSNTGAWTTANSSEKRYFCGSQFEWPYGFNANVFTEQYPSVYDCAEGDFLENPTAVDLLRDNGKDFRMNHWALVQDRLFVLCWKEREAVVGGGLSEQEWFFAEFQIVESGAKWLKLKDHRSTNLGSPKCIPRYVLVCKGFMLNTRVFNIDFEEWSYDLSTGKWHVFSGKAFPSMSKQMCELQWDVVP